MSEHQSPPTAGPTVRNVNDVSPITCPCGDARRIFSQDDQGPVGIHRVTISHEAQRHYHKKTTEYYIILEGEGEIELNDERVPVKPGDVVYIPPLTRHVARGNFEIINVVYPPFDPSDEYLDE